MATITLHLVDGFDNDTVKIQVNGETVFSKENVSTRDLVGLADSVIAEVDTDTADIDVFVPNQGLSKRIHVKAKDTQDVVISVVAGQIDWRTSASPIGFA